MVAKELRFELNFSSKSESMKGFHPLRQRWIVERTFAWFNRYRRLNRDVERTTDSSENMIRISQIQLMLNRLAPKHRTRRFTTEKTVFDFQIASTQTTKLNFVNTQEVKQFQDLGSVSD